MEKTEFKIGDVVSFNPFSKEPTAPLFVVIGMDKQPDVERYKLAAYSETESHSLGDYAYDGVHPDILRKRKIKRVKIDPIGPEFKVGDIVILSEYAQPIDPDDDLTPFAGNTLVIEEVIKNYHFAPEINELYESYDYVVNRVKRKRKESLWLFDNSLQSANTQRSISAPSELKANAKIVIEKNAKKSGVVGVKPKSNV